MKDLTKKAEAAVATGRADIKTETIETPHFHLCPICGWTWECHDHECYPDGSELEHPMCGMGG